MKREYRLPDGKVTTSINRYAKAWSALGKPVAEALNCDVIGYDPGVHLIPKGGQRGFAIDVSIAEKVKNLYQFAKENKAPFLS